MKHTFVCVAGTFDGLHAGHEALLLRAFAEGDHVLIGVTSDEYVQAHKTGAIRSYADRVRDLSGWITSHGFSTRMTIVSIDDPFEPAASDSSLVALIVSEDSLHNGEELNRKRRARGLSPLRLIVVSIVPAEDKRPISATRVRAGEIDRVGRLVLPETLRNDLSLPMGRVLLHEGIQQVLRGYTAQKLDWIITVGDMTTKTFLDERVTPRIMVVDNKINRTACFDLQPIFTSRHFTIVHVASGPGYISQDAIVSITRLLSTQPKESTVLEVEGEEDLLTLPVVAYAPVGAVVYYGQPNEGIVEVVVSEETKMKARALLSQFTTS